MPRVPWRSGAGGGRDAPLGLEAPLVTHQQGIPACRELGRPPSAACSPPGDYSSQGARAGSSAQGRPSPPLAPPPAEARWGGACVFFGCSFIAFGPALALCLLTVAGDPLRVIILVAGSGRARRAEGPGRLAAPPPQFSGEGGLPAAAAGCPVGCGSGGRPRGEPGERNSSKARLRLESPRARGYHSRRVRL